ncbi:MAG TPA: MBL fold metallo-hydrolase [Gammaproteobacteria bacterium]
MIRWRHVVPAAALALGTPAHGQLDDLDEALRTTPIRAERLGDGLHALFGVGGAIIVSIGEQGVLAVDDQFPEMAPKYKEKIRELGGGDIDFVINTHWHFDHADGNKVLGPEGTWIVAHENSRRMMMRDNVVNLVSARREQPAYPAAALPVITFADGMMFHFNGEPIELLHFGPAHTSGDTAVIFRGHNVVHMGDVFNNAGYPFIDADNGGSLDGVIEFTSRVLERIDERTVVVPGHGPIATYADLVAYVEMLSAVRDRIVELIDGGASLEQVVAARPTEPFDERYGNPASFVDRAYTSLVRDR